MSTPRAADPILEAFGGVSATAKALGHRNVTTVHGWKRSGRIPPWRMAEIEKAASELGISLPHESEGEAA